MAADETPSGGASAHPDGPADRTVPQLSAEFEVYDVDAVGSVAGEPALLHDGRQEPWCQTVARTALGKGRSLRGSASVSFDLRRAARLGKDRVEPFDVRCAQGRDSGVVRVQAGVPASAELDDKARVKPAVRRHQDLLGHTHASSGPLYVLPDRVRNARPPNVDTAATRPPRPRGLTAPAAVRTVLRHARRRLA
jgi:hypothetical protein